MGIIFTGLISGLISAGVILYVIYRMSDQILKKIKEECKH